MSVSGRRALTLVGLVVLVFGIVAMAGTPPAPQLYRIDVSTVVGQGQVTVNPEGTPGAPGVYWYWSTPKTVTLEAFPEEPDWDFKEWQIGPTGEPPEIRTENPTTVELTPEADDWTVVAVFDSDLERHTITASADAGGSIDPSGEVQVFEGHDKMFSIEPDEGYVIDDVLVDESSVYGELDFVNAAATYTFTNVADDHTIHATFEEAPTHTITASAGDGGSIDPSGEVEVAEGHDKTFQIEPDEGYVIDDVLVDESSVYGELDFVNAAATYTFTNVADDHTIHATFEEAPTHTITASAGEGGSIDPSGEVEVAEGHDKTFQIEPDEGYEIEDVKVDCCWIGAVEEYTFENVTEDHTIHAEFKPITHRIKATAGEGGSIVPDGDVYVDHGADKTFQIEPDEGYVIDDVKVDCSSVGAVEEYTFTNVTEKHSIHAEFKQVTHTIKATAGDGGSIEPSGDVEVPHGQDKTFQIEPDEGYEIDNVKVDCCWIGAVEEYTFENVEGDHTIHAKFKEVTHTITATATEGGSIQPSGKVGVAHGGNQTFTMTPDKCCELIDVLVDGESVGAVDEYEFTNVTEDHTIHAVFLASKAGRKFDGGVWHLMSIPVIAEDDTPESVFESIIEDCQQLAIYEWNPDTESFQKPEAIEPGRGYWLYLFNDVRIEVRGELPSGEYEVGLGAAGWQLVSTPRWPVAWQSVEFTDQESRLSLTEAINQDWIEPYAFSYCPETESYVAIDLTSTSEAIDPWKGYWIKTRVANLTMILELDDPWIPGMPTVGLSLAEVPARFQPPAPPLLSVLHGDLLTAVSYPSPITGGEATFRVFGVSAERLRVTVLDSGGQEVWRSESGGNQLSWDLIDGAGRAVANGVYLYYVEAKVGGQWLRAEVDRLLVVR